MTNKVLHKFALYCEGRLSIPDEAEILGISQIFDEIVCRGTPDFYTKQYVPHGGYLIFVDENPVNTEKIVSYDPTLYGDHYSRRYICIETIDDYVEFIDTDNVQRTYIGSFVYKNIDYFVLLVEPRN